MALRKARILQQLDVRLFNKIRETLFHILQLLLVLIICINNRDLWSYLQNSAIKQTLSAPKVSLAIRCAEIIGENRLNPYAAGG